MTEDDPTSPFFPFLQQAAKPVVTLKARPRLPEAALAALRTGAAPASALPGQVLRLPVADIEEDPDQPRSVFDAESLQSMAQSIALHGVLQPIVVRPPVNGRYVLAFGARRLRASRLAGQAHIPAVVRTAGAQDFAAQLIENQQRADLSNRELAAAIARLARDGVSNKAIAAICALKDYQVAAFRQVAHFPPALTMRLDNADIRALYDLYRQWGKTPAEVLGRLPAPETFLSITEARRIIGAITGRPTGSIVLDGLRAAPGPKEEVKPLLCEPESEPSMPAQGLAAQGPGEHALAQTTAQAKAGSATAPSRRGQAPERSGAPVFFVAVGQETPGRLVLERRARRAGWALVAYAAGEREVEASQLRIVRVE